MSTMAARSNAISQRVMKPLDLDVFTAAKNRVRHVYETYDRVVVSYSGGKDSTCCAYATWPHKMARRALGLVKHRTERRTACQNIMARVHDDE